MSNHAKVFHPPSPQKTAGGAPAVKKFKCGRCSYNSREAIQQHLNILGNIFQAIFRQLIDSLMPTVYSILSKQYVLGNF